MHKAAFPLSATPSRTALFVLTALLLGACAAGPDFKKPDAPNVASYGPDGLPAETVGAGAPLGGIQRFQAGGDIPAAWWNLFGSPPLNDLIARAVAGSPSLDAARAALRAAQETAKAEEGAFFPSLSASASDNRTKATGSRKPLTVYNTSVSASYAPDIFGAVRRNVESAEAEAQAQNFELEATYLTLTGSVVATAVQEASLREQIAAMKDIIAAEKKQLELTRAQFAAGAVARSSVLAQEANVAASEASLPALEKALGQNRTLLSVLLGQFPSEGVAAQFTLASLKLPETLPLSLPSKLVDQRPDIRAAAALLEAANAKVGIAMAAMLPQFPLTASYGVAAAHMADMFTPTTAIWGLGAGILQPIFRGGELVHTKRAAEAAYEQAAASYRETVLNAFKDVADALQAMEQDAKTLKAQLAAERAAYENLHLTTAQFNAGAISNIDLLSAQTSYQRAKINLVQAKAARLADTAALFQALGGGWWNRTESLVNAKN